MKKKSQRIFAGILAVLVSIAMVGSGLLVFFFDGDESLSGSSSTASLIAKTEAEYKDQKLRIDAMVQQAKADPENLPLQTALANEYYDAGMTAQMVAPNEVQDNFKKAVEAYQKVLKTNTEPNILVDMATAAFYSGDYDLADKSYKEALALKPDFINALFNYGIFLSQAKNDWNGALNRWQKALPLAQTSSEKDQIQAMIERAQSELKANQTDTPTNPILKKE